MSSFSPPSSSSPLSSRGTNNRPRFLVVGVGPMPSHRLLHRHASNLALLSTQKIVTDQPAMEPIIISGKRTFVSDGETYIFLMCPTTGPKEVASWILEARNTMATKHQLDGRNLGIIVLHDSKENTVGRVRRTGWIKNHRGDRGDGFVYHIRKKLGPRPWARITIGVDIGSENHFTNQQTRYLEEESSKGVKVMLGELAEVWR